MKSAEFKKLIKVVYPEKKGNDKVMEVAHHEAGHVLIKLLYGLPGTKTTIIPDERKNSAGSNEHPWKQSRDFDFSGYIFGYCLDNDIDEWSRDKEIEYLVITQMAGIIGGAFYSGGYNWEGAENDFNQIIDVFIQYYITDIPDLQPYWNKTFNLISQNIETLTTIANDLYKAQTLNSEYFEPLRNKIKHPAT